MLFLTGDGTYLNVFGFLSVNKETIARVLLLRLQLITLRGFFLIYLILRWLQKPIWKDTKVWRADKNESQ